MAFLDANRCFQKMEKNWKIKEEKIDLNSAKDERRKKVSQIFSGKYKIWFFDFELFTFFQIVE